MTNPKRILIVDDNFETVDYLENALSLLSGSVTTMGVPSGEEAWLEILRAEIDLMLVDLRLPGMSGSELMIRVQKRYPHLPVIVMSGFAMEMMKRETAGLTVYRFLQKPMDTDRLLQMVEQALFGEERPRLPKPSGPVPVPMRQNLERLRIDTGARQLLLATLKGKLLYQSGDEKALQDVALLQKIGYSLETGLAVSHHLTPDDARSIQFLATQKQEFYFANIGQSHYVALAYDAQNQRARIGTIWVFLQRAIRELQVSLPALSPADVETEDKSVEAASVPVLQETPAGATEKAMPGPVPEPTPDPGSEPVGDPLSLEEALAHGLLPTDFAAVEKEAGPDLEAAVLPELFENPAEEMAAADLFGEVDEEAVEDDLAFLKELGDGDQEENLVDVDETGLDQEPDLSLLDDETTLDDADLDAFWEAAVDELAADDDGPPLPLEKGAGSS